MFYILVGMILIFIAVIQFFTNSKAQKAAIERQRQILEEQKRAQEEQEKIRKQTIQKIINDFAKTGWTDWNDTIHNTSAQFERIKKATTSNNINLIAYNPHTGYAKIRGESGHYYLVNSHRCSCPDFRDRQLPCKHMYYLATVLPDFQEHISYIDIDAPYSWIDTSLWGLRFYIAGKNQNPVKVFINEHGGTWGNSSWKDTTAIVLASDTETSKVLEAKIRNVEILSFDELKSIFQSDDI